MAASAGAAVSLMAQLARQCRERPIVIDDIRSDLCAPLEQVILDHMQRDGRQRTGSINVGGWKSGEDFFAWPDDPVQQLRQVIAEQVGTATLVGWAMVNRAGSHHPRHQHRVAILSGIYYVVAGDPITPTVFECPCDEKARPRYKLEVDPHPARLVLTRGEMWHSVGRYPGELPRITIAFDVRR